MEEEPWEENRKRVRAVLVQILFLNLLVAAIKVILGMVTGTLSILSDGIHSTFDGVSNVIGLVGIKYASEPSDSEHPYGHRKMELVAAMGITSLLVASSIEILKGAAERFQNLATPEITSLTFGLMMFTVIVNVLVTRYEYRRGRELKSLVLVADSMHTRSDVMVSLGVIAGMYGISKGYPLIDPIISIIILGIIMRTAIELFRGASRGLLDVTVVPPSDVHKAASEIPGVRKIHHIRTRGTSDYVFLDACIHVDPSLSLKEGHEISHKVRKKLHEKLPQIRDVVIHIEPADHRHAGHRKRSTIIRSRI